MRKHSTAANQLISLSLGFFRDRAHTARKEPDAPRGAKRGKAKGAHTSSTASRRAASLEGARAHTGNTRSTSLASSVSAPRLLRVGFSSQRRRRRRCRRHVRNNKKLVPAGAVRGKISCLRGAIPTDAAADRAVVISAAKRRTSLAIVHICRDQHSPLCAVKKKKIQIVPQPSIT